MDIAVFKDVFKIFLNESPVCVLFILLQAFFNSNSKKNLPVNTAMNMIL